MNPAPDDLSVAQGESLARKREVLRRTGLSNSQLYRLIAAGRFPRPVSIGDRAVAFVCSEVDQWVAQRIAERGTRE